jgi:ATP-dependent RNA circularization protein (DNA/RNA ligase family)
MHVGSHHQWKKEEENSSWWQVLTPEMINFCKCNPNKVLYGEAYGKVGGFKYGKQGVRFIAFDVLDGTNWLDPENFVNLMDEYKIPRVPVLGWNLPFNFEEFKKLAEGRSVLAESFGDNHIREGCVLKPMIERIDLEIGRVLLKIVGDGYYELK